MLGNQVDAEAAQAISLTEMVIKQAYTMEHKMSKEEAREYFNTAQIELPENYYANASDRSLPSTPWQHSIIPSSPN